MDFDEWTPLGRGDPLKNDPTFDYLPPVLDKVLYWKPPPPSSPASRAHPSTAEPLVPQPAVTYNRRFFLTDFSKREPAVVSAGGPYAPYAYKRYHHSPPPSVAVQTILTPSSSSPPSSFSTSSGGGALQHGYRPYPTMPRTPLPMLTPPPYQRPTSVATTAEPFADARVPPANGNDLQFLGDSAAESKQPPAVRAPAPKPPRPVLSHSVIKVLLENEAVDRTTVTTMAAPTTTTTTEVPPPSTTTDDLLFSRYKQPATVATGTGGSGGSGSSSRPMFLIIQGHSKVKTYGLISKPDDLSAAQSAATAIQEHNHISNGPADEPSRRKRDGGQRSRVVTVREKL